MHDNAFEPDPLDFTIYMDQVRVYLSTLGVWLMGLEAPLLVQAHSPLEVVQQMFVKLGARYVVVINTDGLYQGVIDKKGWLQFLTELEEKS